MISSWLQLQAPLIFLIMANLMLNAKGQDYYCIDIGNNYTANGTYQSNLNTLLSSVSTTINSTGFIAASSGQNPDRVNAIALCRGDLQLDVCRVCVQNASTSIVRLCPNRRQAVLWYEICMLRYSNDGIVGVLATTPGSDLNSILNVTSPDEFRGDLRTLLDDLRGRAAYGGNSTLKVAAGNRSSADSQTIYGLVQCTPDLSPQDCDSCLVNAANDLPMCCDRRIGARILRPSCNLRYEITPFYDATRLPEIVPVGSPSSGNRDNRRIIIIVVSVVGGVMLMICVVLLVRKRMKQKLKDQLELDDISVADSLQHDFERIRAATNGFSEANKLGQGGFGSVYLGQLPDGQEIAVKRLSANSYQGDLEFKTEVMLLAKLQHRNLVRLFGFALQGTERLLVYEYLPNSSLEHFIFERSEQARLDWETCYRIIRGIARGIVYLHEDSRLRIVHRDLKPSNVLLDAEMNPKIADLGMARLFVQPDVTHGNTGRIVGTYGYMAPEYAIHGQFSIKSDVFSFGVLVLEIVSGRKNISSETPESTGDLLINTVWKIWRERTPANVINPCFRRNSGIPPDIFRCIQIGLLCVQQNPTARPTMASIVLMLSSDTVTLPVPSAPAYYLPGEYGLEILDEENNSTSEPSVNTVSITELNPQ